MAGYARNHDIVKVGAFALSSSLLFAGLFGFMTNRTLTREHSDLYLRFPTADGLKPGDAVLFHGVQVGTVKRLSFASDGAVLVRARLTEAVPLRSGANGELVAADIFGRQSLVLRQGAGTERIQKGDTLSGPSPSSLTDVFGGLGDRVSRFLADTTLTLVHGALGGAALASAQLGELAGTAKNTIESQRQDVAAATRAAARIASNLEALTHPTETSSVRANLITSTTALSHASERLDSATGALLRVLARLEAGEGTAGRLLADPALYDRTTAALMSLEALLEDVRSNPRKYINVRVF